MVLTCTGQGTTQRWHVENEAVVFDKLFVSGEESGMQVVKNLYNFTLISSISNNFESTLSLIATIKENNTNVECADHFSRDTVTIKIAGLIY